ncbi:hypothetical protein [Streptomyces albogriseolus]|uniref:hypothetical protein n=1 Tax=Streptomyces albogriseolus TaxID=1887 RepID=UPI0034604125
MSSETISDPSRLAVYIVKNRTRIEDALYELAAGLVDERGEDNAYRETAAALRRMLHQRKGWLSRDRANEVDRIAGDMRELIGMPRREAPRYADPMPLVMEMARTFPGGPDVVLGMYAEERRRCGY